MIDIEWTGDSRNLPQVGMMHEGKTVALKKEIAESLINQGLAKEIKKENKKNKVGGEIK